MTRARLVVGFILLALGAGTAGAGLPTVTHEGRKYVELSRVAESLKLRLDAPAAGTQARLRTDTHVVTLTRNWARILLDGSALEVIANDRTSIATRIYPSREDSQGVRVFGEGSLLAMTIWPMASIWPT